MITVVGKLVVTLAALALSLSAHADLVEQEVLKVTIAVDGMMKSKSGAT